MKDHDERMSPNIVYLAIYFILLCELRMRRLYTGGGDLHNYKQIHIIIGG